MDCKVGQARLLRSFSRPSSREKSEVPVAVLVCSWVGMTLYYRNFIVRKYLKIRQYSIVRL